MKLDEMKPFQKDDGSMMTGDDIRSMVQNFVAAGKGKPGMRPMPQPDPAVQDYHDRNDRLERERHDYNQRPKRQFEEDERHPVRADDNRPWRQHAPPLNKTPSNPNYPKMPFNPDHWNSTSKKMEEDSSEMPESGDTIRTKRSQLEGRVERLEGDTVFFRTPDGRLMKTGCSNAIVIQKLADCDVGMFESEELTEISNALLTKYKTAAAGAARGADAVGDIKTGNKRFSGIVKATNKQFANDAKARKAVTKEGTMGGINRSAPAQDVSYEKVSDRNPQSAFSKVVGEEMKLDELSAEKMQAYKDKAGSADSFRTRPLRKLAKSSQTVATVNNKIAQKRQGPPATTEGMIDSEGEYPHDYNGWVADANSRGLIIKDDKGTGDGFGGKTKGAFDQNGQRIGHYDETTGNGTLAKDANDYQQRIGGGARQHGQDEYQKSVNNYYNPATRAAALATESYADRLEYILEDDKTGGFADILGQQHADAQAAKPKKAVVDIPYHNWTIRYRPASAPGQKVAWQVMDKKNDIKNKGEAMSDKEAVADAQEWVNQGGGTKQQSSSNVTIDFNVDFAREFAPGGSRFYATFDSDNGKPVLMYSTEPQQGFKNSHIRTQKEKTTASTTQLPTITLSAKEANAIGLQPNGRYILGPKDPIDDHTMMFPLIYQGTVQGKGDMMKMGKPGLTVAHPRD